MAECHNLCQASRLPQKDVSLREDVGLAMAVSEISLLAARLLAPTSQLR